MHPRSRTLFFVSPAVQDVLSSQMSLLKKITHRRKSSLFFFFFLISEHFSAACLCEITLSAPAHPCELHTTIVVRGTDVLVRQNSNLDKSKHVDSGLSQGRPRGAGNVSCRVRLHGIFHAYQKMLLCQCAICWMTIWILSRKKTKHSRYAGCNLQHSHKSSQSECLLCLPFFLAHAQGGEEFQEHTRS